MKGVNLSMMSLFLPSHDIVYDGAVLKLGDDPTTYFLHYGEYSYGNKKNCSWYIQAIGTMVAIPITDDMLATATVMNNGADISVSNPIKMCGCDSIPNTQHHEHKEHFTSSDKYALDRSWITVDTVAERDSLPLGIVINGRIVQVNSSTEEKSHYYRYDVSSSSWNEIYLENETSQEDISEIKEAMDNLSEDINSVSTSLDEFKQEYITCIDSLKEYINELSTKIDEIQNIIESE